jgi:hypothetical protein
VECRSCERKNSTHEQAFSIDSDDFVGSSMDEFSSAISQLAGQSRAAFAGCLSN